MRLYLGVRKLQQGGGSVFLNLPTTWIRSLKIAAGDCVSIELEEDGALRISPSEAA